ncbi:MAG: hypothetical protein Q8R44_16540 [Novosphingobium sp.]|nr:hypothetical protein [Novosphingobium sp.]
MSFQIGFSHLTGGETWKSYDDLAKGAAENGGFAAIREERKPTDLANARLRTLTRALGPLYIRYSGTTANSVYFHDSAAPLPGKPPAGFTVALTRAAWKGAVDFAKAVDAKILTSFANSDGVRDGAHAWSPRMAAPWLAYNRAIGGQIYAAELFNEPNAPEPPRIPKGHTAEEFARDFAAFRSFMAQAAPGVKVAGPGNAMMGVPIASIDAVSPEQYAAATPAAKFDIVSYHFYPALAERCAPPGSPAGISVDKALDEGWLARPDKPIARFKALRDKHAPGAPIWITETGGAACGGLRWQPTFLDAFRFLDTHARSARQGVDAMFTHALISGSNGVIDEKTFQPNASYWGAVLWRRLMGTRVLDAGPIAPGLHLYAHCQRGKPGGVALLAINLESAPASVDVGGPADVYALTSPELQSKAVLHNGRALALRSDDTLPAMAPVRVKGGRVTLAPTSIAYIALPDVRNRNCLARAL